jgi:hypothetical protein
MSGGSNEPASPTVSQGARSIDKISDYVDIHMIEQAAAILAGGIDHRACKAALCHERNRRFVPPMIGKRDADSRGAPARSGRARKPPAPRADTN